MKKGTFINKTESVILQSIAIILMVFHHLFAFPDRIPVEIIYVFDFTNFHLETMLSYFGRICIAIFAFNTGYGLMKSHTLNSNYSFKCEYLNIFKRIYNLLKKYWMVFIIFIPLGFCLGVYSFDIKNFIYNFSCLSCSYNYEWWYLLDYIIILLCWPIYIMIFDYIKKYFPYAVNLFFHLFLILFITINYDFLPNGSFFTYFCCAVVGAICVEYSVFESIYSILNKNKLYTALTGISVLFLVLLVKLLILTNSNYDYLIISFFVFSVMLIIKLIPKIIKRILYVIGKYSTYIWLTHTFYIYYYFGSLFYRFKYSFIIFIITLVACVVTGYLLDKLYSILLIRSPK